MTFKSLTLFAVITENKGQLSQEIHGKKKGLIYVVKNRIRGRSSAVFHFQGKSVQQSLTGMQR